MISDNVAELNLNMDAGITEELLVALLKLLMKYLMDDSVRTVDITSQVLRVSAWRFTWHYSFMVLLQCMLGCSS